MALAFDGVQVDSMSIVESLAAEPAEYLSGLLADGCLGRKTGRGFYAYDTP